MARRARKRNSSFVLGIALLFFFGVVVWYGVTRLGWHLKDSREQVILDVALDCRATRTVLTWGLSDRYLDPPQSLRLKLTGWQGRRLPYDRDLAAKPLRTALTQTFRTARARPGPDQASSR